MTTALFLLTLYITCGAFIYGSCLLIVNIGSVSEDEVKEFNNDIGLALSVVFLWFIIVFKRNSIPSLKEENHADEVLLQVEQEVCLQDQVCYCEKCKEQRKKIVKAILDQRSKDATNKIHAEINAKK